MNLYSSL